MSAQETSATAHLFPVGLLPEELAHHLESFPTNRTLSNEQLTEYQGAKFKVLAWLDTVARTYQNQCQ